MVPARVERATKSLGNFCSIHLSYGTEGARGVRTATPQGHFAESYALRQANRAPTPRAKAIRPKKETGWQLNRSYHPVRGRNE